MHSITRRPVVLALSVALLLSGCAGSGGASSGGGGNGGYPPLTIRDNDAPNTPGVGASQIGDPDDDTAPDSGAVYVFTRDGALAVGAFREASNASGLGGDQTNNSADLAGAVYLY